MKLEISLKLFESFGDVCWLFFDLIKVFEDYENETFSIDGLLEVIFYDRSVYSQNHVLKGASTVKCDHVFMFYAVGTY